MASGIDHGYGQWMHDWTKRILRAEVDSQNHNRLEGCDEETEMEKPFHGMASGERQRGVARGLSRI
jgi:hypothetical protein